MDKTELTGALESALSSCGPIRGPILRIQQFEERHPGTKGRMRHYILHADSGCAGYEGLRSCVIRIGRSVMLDEAGVLEWLATHSGQPASPPRNPHGRTGKKHGGRG
jgi:hypothetical protein